MVEVKPKCSEYFERHSKSFKERTSKTFQYPTKCPQCNSTRLVKLKYSMKCLKCGYINSKVITLK